MPPNNTFKLRLACRDAVLEEMRQARSELAECPKTKVELRLRKELAVGHWKSFQERHEEALSSCPNLDEIGRLMGVRREASAVYMEAMTEIEEAINALDDVPIPSMNEIKLRTFAGEWKEWASWRAVFEDKVLNTGLRVPQKIELLLEALADQAKEAAGQSEKRDQEELDRIWGKLVDTYDNPYQQIYAHVFDMLALPNIDQPSAEKYRHMVNKVEENMRLLARYDVLKNWNALLSVIMLQKLDQSGRYLYNTKFDKSKFPDVECLFKFLGARSRALEDESRAKSIRVWPAPSGSNLQPKAPPAKRSYRDGVVQYQSLQSDPINYQHREIKREDVKPYTRQAAANFKSRQCPLCQKDHPLIACPAFVDMNVQQRHDAVQRISYCERCLRSPHPVDNCYYRKGCEICPSLKHHTLLCFESRKTEAPRQIN